MANSPAGKPTTWISGRSERSQRRGARRSASAGVLFSVRRAKSIKRHAVDGPLWPAYLCFALAGGADLPGAPRDESLHLAGRAVLHELLFEDLVDLTVFVGVLDLPAALLLAPVGELAAAAAGRVDAHVAGAESEIARPGGARVEVLVRAVVARHDDHGAHVPVALDHVGAVFLGPDEREARRAAQEQKVRARAVAVGLFVGADGEFRYMVLGVVVGHLEHGVDAAGAPLLPSIDLHVGRVGDEVRLPSPPGVELALAAEVILLAGVAARELVVVVEDEIVVLEQAHHRRRVCHGDVAAGR